jgi:pterin-4a-carbinolamine dehydratase
MPGSGLDPSLGDELGAYHQISHRVHHEDFNNGCEIPYGVSLANDNNHHPAYPTINKNLNPRELDTNSITNSDQSVAWMRESSNAVVADASIGAFLNEELDLNLRL